MRPKHFTVPALLFVAALSACGGPRVDLATENAALAARSDALIAAEAAKDLKAGFAFYAADAIVHPASAPAISDSKTAWVVYQQIFEDPALKSSSGMRTALVIAASGDLAYEHGVNRMVITTPAGEITDVGKYLAVWKKVDGQWMVAMLAFSSDAPPPPMPAAPPATKVPLKK